MIWSGVRILFVHSVISESVPLKGMSFMAGDLVCNPCITSFGHVFGHFCVLPLKCFTTCANTSLRRSIERNTLLFNVPRRLGL